MFIFIYHSICKFTCSFNFSGKQYKDEAFLELPKDLTEGLNIKKKVGHKSLNVFIILVLKILHVTCTCSCMYLHSSI